MRSDVVWWTDEKIAFYERASMYSSFHRDLASLIEEHIGKDDTIMELGAGLGHVTSILYNDGYTISAYDSCKNNALPEPLPTATITFTLSPRGIAFYNRSRIFVICLHLYQNGGWRQPPLILYR